MKIYTALQIVKEHIRIGKGMELTNGIPEALEMLVEELAVTERALGLACKTIDNVTEICPADLETFSGEYCDECSAREVADCWREHYLSIAKEADPDAKKES